MPRRLVPALLAAVAVAGVVLWAPWREAERGPRGPGLTAEEERIVRAALRAAERVVIPDPWDVVVETEPGVHVVTWPYRYDRPRPGPDFYARVRLRAETLEVLTIQVDH